MATRESILAWINLNNKYLNYSDSYASRMKTMKLAFLADGLFMQENNRSLFESKFQAWNDGPVDNSMYAKQLQHDYVESDANFLLDDEIKILDKVNRIYGIYSAAALSEMTHTFESWLEQVDKNLRPKAKHIPMNVETIKKDFELVSNNIDLFEDYTKNFDIEIIKDVSVLIEKEKKELFNKHIDANYIELSQVCENLKGKKDFLLFVDILDNGDFTYEV